MQITAITPSQIYQISGEHLLSLIAETVEQTVSRINAGKPVGGEQYPHKLSTPDAAAYLGVKVQTLHVFQIKYRMQYEKGSPNYYPMEELKRVERERLVRPH